jgi:hypothetical protein
VVQLRAQTVLPFGVGWIIASRLTGAPPVDLLGENAGFATQN